jgi:Holliday junction resolvase
MTNDNRKVGTSFEQTLCRRLSDYGFWAHNLAQNKQGQPFDVIAARHGYTYPIDCKVCEKDIFRLDRIEENQYSAMRLWRETGNGEGWFALLLTNGEIRFLSLADMESFMLTRKCIYLPDIRQYGLPLEVWVLKCGW